MRLYEILEARSNVPVDDAFAVLFAGEHKTSEISGVPPVSFTSKGGVLEDYLISGNTVQNGTPTPSYPVDVVGCGERTGNLFYKILSGMNININGRIISNSDYDLVVARVTAGETYSVTGCDGIMAFYVNEPALNSYSYNNTRESIVFPVTIPEGVKYVAYRVADRPNNAMLNTGPTPLPYEPYGYKLPVSCGGTTTNVYLGETQSTRKIKKLVLDGGEDWTEVTEKKYWIEVTNYQKSGLIAKCTHYIGVNNGSGSSAFTNGTIGFCSSSANRLMICDTSQPDVESFKQFLAAQYAAGTPVIVWYVLATPETAVVNEPLMKIGDYADTISFAQAGVTIPTVAGTNTLTVGTTVQPSNVSITGQIKPVTA